MPSKLTRLREHNETEIARRTCIFCLSAPRQSLQKALVVINCHCEMGAIGKDAREKKDKEYYRKPSTFHVPNLSFKERERE